MKNASSDKSLNYTDRINRAIDHIIQNLDQPLNLERVAKAAHFSPFHFHRIFKSLVGESLNEFIKRLRLERALALLSQKDWKSSRNRSLTQIALDCGFNSSADFSRCFKQQFGKPPSKFDIQAYRNNQRHDWQSAVADPQRHHLIKGLLPGENPDNFQVKIRNLPPRTVAYIRVHNSYQPNAVLDANHRLMQWAQKHGHAQNQWLGYMWDDPEIVPHNKCRYDVAVEIPDLKPSGEIGRFQFPAMKIAQLEIDGSIDLEMRALDYLFKTWLPNSGYLPTNHPGFEAWIGPPFAHGHNHFHLLLQLPIQHP